eukprot:COSAG02_NODE_692_length_18432_cov_12.452681_8_plen_99_part_00
MIGRWNNDGGNVPTKMMAMKLLLTGTPGNTRTYTLTLEEEIIDLSSKNLGPADVTLIAAWLQRSEVVTRVDVRGNALDKDVLKELLPIAERIGCTIVA